MTRRSGARDSLGRRRRRVSRPGGPPAQLPGACPCTATQRRAASPGREKPATLAVCAPQGQRKPRRPLPARRLIPISHPQGGHRRACPLTRGGRHDGALPQQHSARSTLPHDAPPLPYPGHAESAPRPRLGSPSTTRRPAICASQSQTPGNRMQPAPALKRRVVL